MKRQLMVGLLFTFSIQGSVAAQSKPAITPKDFGKWESLAGVKLSAKGEWIAYGINRGNEENDLRIRGGPRDTTIVVPYGSAPAFSADGMWIAYSVGVSPTDREKLQKEKKPVQNSVAIRNLSTGATTTIADVTSFAFSPNGRFIAMRRYPAEGKHSADLFVQDVSSGTRLNFGNVTEYEWSGTRPLLAFALDAEGGTGNAIQLYDGATGIVRVLESSTALYRQLTWRPKSDDLAALRSRVDKDFRDTANVVIAWNGLGGSSAPAHTLDPATASGFPGGMRVAEYRRPSWSKDGATVFFGLKKREPVAEAIKKGDEKVSDVQIWHTKDVRMLPGQQLQESQDLHATVLGGWRVTDGKVMQLGTDLHESVTLLDGGRYATETDKNPYPFGTMFGRHDQDIYLIDLTTGERKKILTKIRHFFGANPGGTKLAWFDGKDYWTIDIASGTRTNLTANLTGKQKIDFVNHEDDHPTDVLPPIGSPTWTKNDGPLLVSDEYNVWSVALDGSGGKRLTDGAAEQVAHRVQSFGGFFATPEERAVDLTKPVYLTLYGTKTKKSGFASLTPSGAVERLIFADAMYGQFGRADSADVFMFTRQRYDESPNVFLAGADLANPRKMSNTNAFQSDYAWGKAELLNYKSTIGRPLQAILFYPPNYDPSKKYPMIVYTYELLTQGLHQYRVPSERDEYNATVFNANGYFVLMPDIVFRPREPGIAVLHSVEPAVRAVVAKGLVDSTRVGHCGHSQGGYEADFLGTHSKLFATTVGGAGITDMVSFAGQMHWSAGFPEFDHWETGQFRMQVAPWEDFPAMIANSPLATVQNMTAKAMLLEIGDVDGVVDMRQGVEFYNYARRAGKNVVLLVYPGENHGLAKKENAIDYHRRILEWYAYYLKGETPAKWITEGQTWLDRKAILDANK